MQRMASTVELHGVRSDQKMPSQTAGSSTPAHDLKRRPSERTPFRAQQISLRRVKDSTDVLRDRSLLRQRSKKGVPVDDTSATRDGKGRHFTVANVGENGMIYLRPLQKTQSSPPSHTLQGMHGASRSIISHHSGTENTKGETQARDSIWTQTSADPRQSPGSSGASGRDAQQSKRPQSQSTSDDNQYSEQLDAGTLKIVIDRSNTATRSDHQADSEQPSLEVPIPHYRLGTPRFSARGTAFLHQSVTQSSVTGDLSAQESPSLLAGDYGRFFSKPSGIEAHAVLSRRHSHASPQPYSIQTSPGQIVPSPLEPHAYYGTSRSPPISPQVYNILAANPNDPAIVKFSPINGDIIAATPARIIVQITSEAFLDYELLSDFFLTVRAYLSTHDLLSLLLARFEWAINRFDDNGRVIRVRAFAALRHWILNYFSYDFVTDRELRVKFCGRINAVSKLVKGRGQRGMSDLKLIADLKKCWNGRCSLFWDSPPLAGEGLQEIDIQPGGIVGSRDSQLVHQSQLRFQPVAPHSSINPIALTAGSTSIANWYTAVMEHSERQAHGHTRQVSGATSRSLPLSPSSEHSVPILSCSIPAKGFKRPYPYANKALGIHPIPTTTTTTGRRVCPAAPSSWSREPARANAEHRRSGSFSDAARDKRAPLSAEVPSGIEEFGQDATLSDRSLLRGHYIAPGGPYVSAVASTPAAEVSRPTTANARSGTQEQHLGRRQVAPNHPAMKGFIGNIRRALSNRHTGANMSYPPAAAANVIPAPALPSLGKSASVPLNVMFQATSTGQLESYRSIRVDLLAAEIYDSFRQATTSQDPAEQAAYQGVGVAAGLEGDRPLSHNISHENNEEDAKIRLRPVEIERLNSAMTNSSQSILIVDDTRDTNIPEVDLSSAQLKLHDERHHDRGVVDKSESVLVAEDAHGHYAEAHEGEDSGRAVRAHSTTLPNRSTHSTARHDGDVTSAIETANMTRNQSQRTTRSPRSSLRRYASYQSTFTKRSVSMSEEAKHSTSFRKAGDTAAVGSGPARMLRRRPGGDLRANHNVHDLGPTPRPRSTGSITTYTDSVRGSEALGFAEKIARTFNTRKSSRAKSPADQGSIIAKPLSIVRTHSSQPQKRRPSFEAAVAQFARIPDDEDDGGVAATLLKLEGKYKSPVQSPTPQTFPESVHMDDRSQSSLPTSSYRGTGLSDRLDGSHEGTTTSIGDTTKDNVATIPQTQLPGDAREQLVSTLYAGSDDSYNSVPLLERETVGEHQNELYDTRRLEPRHKFHELDGMSSGEILQETPSLRRLRHGSVAPTTTTDSFLLDENDEFLSESSSELSLETIEAETPQWPLPNTHADNEDGDLVVVGQHHPPSTPMTVDHALSTASRTDRSYKQERPPASHVSSVSLAPEISEDRQNNTTRVPVQPRHMPFILGCDSDILAQQFTLVEKDALKEVDWRDLVDMRWQNAATSTTNWVDYLLTQDPLGIDLVTARFNIMVKWALSEIVLTENIEERALTIMKYIHIAQQCRKLNNYATLFQMTIALTSADCTRLSKTWDRVPEKEKDILQDLEMLVSPRRNFHNLRTEMEKANADQGCIPVVALYIHDLTYNAQKPSQVSGVLNGEPLINFERYRSTAVIVKNLLRLIDASTKYSFHPIEGVIERCLWMACLTDEMINHRSRQLEYKSS